MNKVTISNPIPNLRNFEQQSLSTKKARKKCFTNPVAPPKAPIRSCPVPRTFSIFKNEEPRAVSFKQNADISFIADSPIYSSNKGTYFEQCYTLEKILGKGSFGEVFKVHSKETGQAYACKRTLLKYRGESDRSRRIEEVKKHEQLPSHLNCVKFYRAWEERNHLYLLTEVCQSTLAEIMASKHELPEWQIWNYLIDILQGLDHLHMHKLIHMDVKPENIFLGLDGYCKLGDFGLVIDFSKGYPSEAVEGDPKYLAPECLQNIYTPAADIFSLGMVVLEMATDLYLPQRGPQWHELRSGALPKVAQQKMSEEMQELLQGLLNPNPMIRLMSNKAIKSIRRIREKTSLVIDLRNMVNSVKDYIKPLLLWPLSLASFLVSFLSYQSIINFVQKYSFKPFTCSNKKSIGEEMCNISDEDYLKNFHMHSPLVKSTPISHARRRVILPHNVSPCHSEQDSSEVNKYSFNESSFSSLESSHDDLLKPEESECNPMNVTSRNLLELFNTVDDSDSET